MKIDLFSIAPFATPVAPGMLLANQVYQGMAADGIHPALAFVGALIGLAGLELCGVLAFRSAMNSLENKRAVSFILASLAAAGYVLLMVWGVNRSPHAASFAVLAFGSVVGYIAQGIEYSGRQKATTLTQATQAEIELLKAKTAELRAETKLVKTQTESPGNLPPENGKITDWRKLSENDRSMIANMNTKHIQDVYGVSERTARNWHARAATNALTAHGKVHR